MKSSRGLLLVLITLAIIHIVQSQDQLGFISLDCGLPANEPSPYMEATTGLEFSSDATYIQSGKTGRVRATVASRFLKPYTSLRYFPDGIRNCYNLPVEKGRNHLIRASFIYGNYDGLNIYPVFDLYLGPNPWTTIDLETLANDTRKEILHIPTSNSVQICLVKTGRTIPLISTLEVRPMDNGSYVTKFGSLKRHSCNYLSKSSSRIRFSADVYDRIWTPYFQPGWTQISTTLQSDNSNEYMPPRDALKTAATPTNARASLTIEWTSENPGDQYYLYAHFSEIEDFQANETREFNLTLNGKFLYGPMIPPKLGLITVFSVSPKTCQGGECSFQLFRTNNSTLPPLLNALEIYTFIPFLQSETHEKDVVAIRNIGTTYRLNRINWQGDPCVPQTLRWDALNCSNTGISTPPRITSLNLSSSGLTGTITAAIQNLTQLKILDLSNNNLTGGIPEFLGHMEWLLVINLSGNNLNGLIPQALQKKGLALSVEGNPRLCLSDPCQKPSKKKALVPIVASVASAAIVIVVLLVLFLVLRKKKSTTGEGLQQQPPKTPVINVTSAN